MTVIDAQQVKIAYDANNNPVYVGLAAGYDVGTSEKEWEIWQLTFNASNYLTDVKVRTLDWDNRTVGW